MSENRYSKLLTVILIVVIIAILGLLIFWGIDIFRRMSSTRTAESIVDEIQNTIVDDGTGDQDLVTPILNEEITQAADNSGKWTYKGYNVVGTIEIPKIGLKYPILERVTSTSIEASVAVMVGPGPNQIGNTVIAGHNYRNGSFFGKNKQLSLGDKIYITDLSGTRIQYNIYNIYETTPDDADFIMRDTNGKREISLSTCTDNSKGRLIIWAVEE